jgi:hypothetical protein
VSSPIHRREPPVPRLALWFALLGGPIAWSAHLLASYPLVSVACQLQTTAPLNLITAITATLAAAAGITGAVAHRRIGQDGPGGLGDSYARARFMALAGLIAGAFFTFVILVEGLPPLLQDPCLRDI